MGRSSGVEPLTAGPQPAVLPLNYDRHISIETRPAGVEPATLWSEATRSIH